MSDVSVIYEDEHLIAVDKPAGLLVHPSWLDRHESDTLSHRLKSYFQQQGASHKVHTVHRLDRPTSGIMLVAKSEAVARDLAEQFRNGSIKKRYWAICRGFCETEFSVDYALVEQLDKIADKYAQQDKPAQPAVTHFKRLAIAELAHPVSRYSKSRFSWLECWPETGRKHQIRRHLKHVRHPILVDSRYGCRHHNKLAQQQLGIASLALRAVSIDFFHPVLNKNMMLEVPANPLWLSALREFGWS